MAWLTGVDWSAYFYRSQPFKPDYQCYAFSGALRADPCLIEETKFPPFPRCQLELEKSRDANIETPCDSALRRRHRILCIDFQHPYRLVKPQQTRALLDLYLNNYVVPLCFPDPAILSLLTSEPSYWRVGMWVELGAIMHTEGVCITLRQVIPYTQVNLIILRVL